MLSALNHHVDTVAMRSPEPSVPDPQLDSVLDRPAWQWWRRALNLPSNEVQTRESAWRRLNEILEDVGKPDFRLPGQVGTGIFGTSLAYLELLDRMNPETPLTVEGVAWNVNRCRQVSETCPFGRLTLGRRVAEFAFDITEVEGIAESKSAGRYFPDVNAFGRDFTEYKGATVDAAGLARMLAHHQIRILDKDRGDNVYLRLWDGRLFLNNAGGSHHFAGAAYISRSISSPVPLSSSLQIYALNEPAVRWLISKFAIFMVPQTCRTGLLVHISTLLGHCYKLPIPGCVGADADLLLIPSDRRLTGTVVATLARAGIPDLVPWLESLLARQAQYQEQARQRFGARVPCLDGDVSRAPSAANK